MAAALVTTSAAHAATFNFVTLANAQGIEQGYQPYVVADGGITLTASGRSLDNNNNYWAYLDKTDGSGDAGLGVCKSSDCNGIDDDNVTLNELLNLSFSEMVKITSITFRDGGHQQNFIGSAGFAVDDLTATTLGEFAAFTPGDNPANLVNLVGTSFQFIAGSTFQGVTSEDHGRRLYLSSITVESTGDLPGVPEPGTVVLLGLGLVGIAARIRRGRK